MPYRRLFIQKAGSEPKAVAAMTVAYDRTIRELKLADKNDPLTELIANKIIQLAATGECDPDRLSALALSAFRPGGRPPVG